MADYIIFPHWSPHGIINIEEKSILYEYTLFDLEIVDLSNLNVGDIKRTCYP